ncbi:MAG: putative Ig domain-containing protein, partial [Mariniblastus sp.]
MRKRFDSDNFLQVEKLEPRMMLNGDTGELVFQAGFEDVTVPVGEFRFFENVSGFTATVDPVEVQNNSPAVGPASEGTNLLELDGTNGVFVEISEVPAGGLLLQGDYSARRGFDALQNTIEVLWNGEVISTLSSDGRGLKSTDFQEFEISLTGGASNGRLEFRSTTQGDQFGAGGLLDDIKVFKFANERQPPTLRSIADQTAVEGETFSLQLVATDSDSNQNQLTFSAIRSPNGSTLNPNSGVFQWTPTSAAAGRRFFVEVQVTDETGLTDTESFRVTVEDSSENLPPVLENIEDRTVEAESLVSVQLVASDPDSAQSELTYSALRAPAGSSVDPTTGLFTWTPNSFASGLRFGIDVQVTDETGLSDTKTFRVTVNDIGEDSAPVLAEIDDQQIDEGALLSVQLSATDEDSSQDQLRYSALRSPVGSNLDPVSGLFTWTPNSFTGGLTFGIDVQVTDETGLTDVQTFRVSVADVDNGSAPVLADIEDQTTTEQQTISVQLVATDSDSRQDQLSYSALRSPVGSTLDPVSGLFTWTSNSFTGGLRFGIDVQVTDQTGLTDTQTFRISVNEDGGGNSAPVMRDIEKQTITEGEQLNVQLVATDADSDQSDLRFEALRSPVGSTLDPVTGLFSWTPNSFAGGLTFGVDVKVTDETGLSDTKTFRIEVQEESDEILLLETQDFETVATRNITIGESINELEIDFDASFDRRDANSINDAFEIALLDLGGNSLVHTVETNRDSFFNRTEDEAPVGGVNTVVMGQKVKLDLSHVAVGTSANLVFRLVNNDEDTNTQVRITSIVTSDNILGTPVGAAATTEAIRADGPIDFTRLSDVTGSLEINYGQTSFNQADGALYSKIEFTNVGQVAISGRMLAVFDNPTSEQISLVKPDGRLPDGRFFIEVTPKNGQLMTGETTVSQDLILQNQAGEQFGFELTILAEVNNAPTGFTSVPPTVIEAGRTVKYTAVAIDPDEGQVLRYSVVQGDSAISIDETTGELSWLTATRNIGANNLTIRATDPFGLFVDQSFTVDVVETLQNRPPNFVTDPVTDAIASSGFEISTVAAGAEPSGVAVINGFRGPGLVTLNTGNQSLSQIDSLGNDLFDLPTQVSVGEPAPTGQVLRSGYSVDVGLPAFEHSGDQNAIDGMDQADLNGDGTLDLVVSAFARTEGPRTFRQLINVTLGNPDGTFGEATTVAELPASSVSKYSTLRVADFDNDGRFDILTMDRQTSTMTFLQGDGQGGFADAVSTTLTTNLYNFKSVDLDQDGNLDLVGMSNSQQELGYMLGLGDGTFDEFVTVYGDPAGPLIPLGAERNYAITDMDGDGDQDIVVSDYRERTISVLSNDGALGFSVAATLDALYPFYPFSSTATTTVFAVFVGDFDGDSHADIAYGALNGSSGNNGGLGVYLGDGTGGNFVYQDGADAIVEFPNNAAGNGDPVDIDNDGDLDIVVASSRGGRSSDGQTPSVLINRGDGTFATTNLTVPAFGEAPYEFINNESNAKGVLVGDYNQDGLLDISTYRTNIGGSYASVTVMLADQPGVFASSVSLVYESL